MVSESSKKERLGLLCWAFAVNPVVPTIPYSGQRQQVLYPLLCLLPWILKVFHLLLFDLFPLYTFTLSDLIPLWIFVPSPICWCFPNRNFLPWRVSGAPDSYIKCPVDISSWTSHSHLELLLFKIKLITFLPDSVPYSNLVGETKICSSLGQNYRSPPQILFPQLLYQSSHQLPHFSFLNSFHSSTFAWIQDGAHHFWCELLE